MNAEELRTLQAPFKERYTSHPELAKLTMGASGVSRLIQPPATNNWPYSLNRQNAIASFIKPCDIPHPSQSRLNAFQHESNQAKAN